MIEFLTEVWGLIQTMLDYARPILPELAVIGASLLVSWCGTQTLKVFWRVAKKFIRTLDDNEQALERGAYQLVAILLMFLPLYPMWQGPNAFWVSLALSLLSPYLYQVVMQIAYQRWPWLEAVMSGSPSVKVKRDATGHVYAVKVDDDRTIVLPRKKDV